MGVLLGPVVVLAGQRGAGRLEQGGGIGARLGQVLEDLGRRILVLGEFDLEGDGFVGLLLGPVEIALDQVARACRTRTRACPAMSATGAAASRAAGRRWPGETFAIGRVEVLFVDRDFLEQFDGFGLSLLLDGVDGQPELLRGGAPGVERGAVVLEQPREFLLFDGREVRLSGGGPLKKEGGALIVAAALRLDGVDERAVGIGGPRGRRRRGPCATPGVWAAAVAAPATRPTTRKNPVPTCALATMASFACAPFRSKRPPSGGRSLLRWRTSGDHPRRTRRRPDPPAALRRPPNQRPEDL